ncbi:MAG: DHA2 family efflux MFS transporter permease subunit [Candidatus Lokiarchaeota archaeon]|nr:DHA2 family efflux MFS transporter permease subunit [Candidatus Lokiarchaeota archaeon]
MVKYKWTVLGVTTVGSFMTSLDGSILNIAIPALSKDLKTSFEIVQWIPIVYLLVMAVTLIAFGRLSDIRGRKNFFLLGIILFTFSSFLCMLSTSGEMVIIFRAIQGTGSAFIAAISASMITEVFPHQETGKALGIYVASIYLGLVLGPVLGGLLIQVTGTWRTIFTINLPIGVILIIIGFLKLKQSELKLKDESFDILGTIAFGIALALFLLSLSLANTFGWMSPIILSFIIISIISFISYIIIETKVKYPMLNLNLFKKNRIFAAANVAALINYIATMGVSFLLSIYLQSILGIFPAITAFFLVPTTLTMAVSTLFSGRLSDKIGTRIPCTVGLSIMAVGLFSLVFIITYLNIIYIIISQSVIGFGIGLFSSPNQSAIMKSVEKRDLGIASGTLSTMRVIGQSISIALLSAILAIFIPPYVLNPVLSHQTIVITSSIKASFEMGMHTAFIVSAIICIFGALISMVRGKETFYREK